MLYCIEREFGDKREDITEAAEKNVSMISNVVAYTQESDARIAMVKYALDHYGEDHPDVTFKDRHCIVNERMDIIQGAMASGSIYGRVGYSVVERGCESILGECCTDGMPIVYNGYSYVPLCSL